MQLICVLSHATCFCPLGPSPTYHEPGETYWKKEPVFYTWNTMRRTNMSTPKEMLNRKLSFPFWMVPTFISSEPINLWENYTACKQGWGKFHLNFTQFRKLPRKFNSWTDWIVNRPKHCLKKNTKKKTNKTIYGTNICAFHKKSMNVFFSVSYVF